MSLAERIQHLRRLPRSARVSALSETLSLAQPDEIDALAVELIELAIGADDPPRAFGGPIRPLIAPVRWVLRRRSERLARPARRELARRWAVLSAECRETALAIGRGRWDDAVESLVGSTSADERLCAALLVGDLGRPDMVGPLVTLLFDDESRVSKSAEAGLVRAAGRVGGVRVIGVEEKSGARDVSETGEAVTASARLAFENHLLRAIAGVDTHRRRGVVLAALVALGEPRPGIAGDDARPLVAWLNRREDPGHMVLRSVLRRAREPLVRSRAWHWLTRDPIAAAALDRLARAETTEEHEIVLRHGHLAAHPGRRSRLRMIKVRPKVVARNADDTGAAAGLTLVRWPAAGPMPGAATVRALSVGARRNLPRWACSLNMDAASRQRALDPLLTDCDAAVRHAAARAASLRALADYCFDRDARVARTAVLRASNVGTAATDRDPGIDARVAERLGAHPAAAVRVIAEQECARLDPWGESPASHVCARRRLRDDRESLLAELHGRITSGGAERRVGAIMLCRRLGLAETLEAELQLCVRGPGAWGEEELRVAATAISALGEAGTPTSRRVVRSSLEHAGNRVRANAIEAIGRWSLPRTDLAVTDPPTYAQMIELKSDANHRVRANAIGSLLRGNPVDDSGRVYEPHAVEGLLSMLSDERRMHRIAGLWLTDRLLTSGGASRIKSDTATLAACVTELAGEDQDPDIRARASACTRALVRRAQAGWTERAADVGMEVAR